MSKQQRRANAPELADQAAARTVAPAAHPAHGAGEGAAHSADEHLDHDHDHDHEHDHGHEFSWTEGVRIALVGLAAAAVWFQLWEPLRSISVIGVLGLAIGGWPIFKEAFENLSARRMTMELSMSIAIVAAAAISQFFTALIITTH